MLFTVIGYKLLLGISYEHWLGISCVQSPKLGPPNFQITSAGNKLFSILY